MERVALLIGGAEGHNPRPARGHRSRSFTEQVPVSEEHRPDESLTAPLTQEAPAGEKRLEGLFIPRWSHRGTPHHQRL